ncbi:MAG TPA: prolipoprotein diacylglyceryl transferase [Flavipsychrobacter sp.]|nr:prolipoprotein diacylglyceryl transferase [Flavipsychrobacter sp.]
MYPDFHHLIENLFGIDAPEWLGLFKTFGLFVALGFLAGAYVLVKDLKNKEIKGLMVPEFTTIEVGKPATANEILWASLIGFILGHKIGGFYGYWQEISPNPMGYVFSLQGNFIAGIIGALIMGYLKYAEKKKEQLPKPEQKRIAIYPHQRITEFVVIAMIAGLAGAKIFNAFETWDEFVKNPVENLLSSSGLTFYGGLITAAIAIGYYARKHNIPIKHLADSFAPALMLSYGIGRFGCHFAGDGDWGIFNSAYVTELSGMLRDAAPGEFIKALHTDTNYMGRLIMEFGSIDKIPHIYQPAPGWLPDWVFAMNYPNNVNNEGMPLLDCTGYYCSVLPIGVFPTALYEAFTCIILFFILWSLRGKMKQALHLSGIYLIMNGLERFLVEKIRVNYKYDWGFLQPTQAEIISFVLIIFGICLLVFVRDRKKAVG